MRVGLDGTPLIGARTGVGRYTHDLVDALSSGNPDDEFVLFPISWRSARVLEAPPQRNVAVVRRFAPALPLWWSWRHLRWPPVERFVDCEVFHATNFIGPPSRRVPLVATVHDLSFLHFPDGVSPAVATMGRVLPSVLDRAAAVITPSQFVADELVEWHPSIAGRVTAIHHGYHDTVMDPRTPTPLPDGPPYVLMLGSVMVRKNAGLLLGAVARLRADGLDVRAVLAGAPDDRVDAVALRDQHGLSPDAMVTTGYLDDAAMASLLHGAAAFAFPSRYEGFGLPLLEAMDAGIPVVAARAGATVEVVGDAALLVDPDDVSGFAGALHLALVDESVRRALVAKGRRRLADFSWRAAADATRAVYAALS